MIARNVWLLPALVFGILTLGACGGGGGSSEPPTAVDTTPPVFSSMAPANGATGVPLNSSVTVTFSEALNCSTATASGVTLAAGETAVPGAVSCSGANVTFKPSAAMSPNQPYSVRITGVADTAGNVLAEPVVKGFTTGVADDLTAPTVSLFFPADNATEVPLDTVVTADFSEALDPATVTAANFTLKADGVAVPATVTYDGTNFIAELAPTLQLLKSTVYTATVTTGVKDLSGNPLAAAFSWSFTSSATDTAPPRVSLTTPADNATFVNSQTEIKAVFNEPVDRSTVDGTILTLSRDGAPVSGTASLGPDDMTVTFTPAAQLVAGTYTATISAGTADLVGNLDEAGDTWNFTVAVPALTASPTLSKSQANNNEQVQITLPVSPNAHTITVCLAPKPSTVAAASRLLVSPSAVDIGGCETITNSTRATEIFVDVNVQADAIWGDYYPTVVLTEEGTGTPLRSLWESGSLSPTFYTVSTATGTADDFVSTVKIPFLVVGPAPDLQATINSATLNGSNLTVNFTVRNAGQGSAGASKTDFFVDPAGLPAVGQTGNLRVDVPALAAGAIHTANAVVSGVASPALVFALADSLNSVPESDENNNLGPWANLNAVPKIASTDVPQAISSPGSVESTLQVSSAITSLRYIAVDLGIAHTFDEDLTITLIAPSGAQVVLSNKRGGAGDNFTGTIFHDGAATAIAAGTAPFTGQFRPDQPLAALLGTNPNGLWRLKVADDNDFDLGTLQSWGLRLW